MYTTGDLDKSTHKSHVCRISTRLEMKKKKKQAEKKSDYK